MPKPPAALRAYLAKLGRKGGKARAESLTPERRKEIARMGRAARTAKAKSSK